jgi:hypothetical protein
MVTIFILNGRLSDLSFRQWKGTKKSCVLQIKSQKRHEKRHVLKIVPFLPTFFTFFVQSTLRVASLQLKFPPSPIWKIYPIYLYIFIYIIYRHIFSLGIGIKINCNIATLQRKMVFFLISIDSFFLIPWCGWQSFYWTSWQSSWNCWQRSWFRWHFLKVFVYPLK